MSDILYSYQHPTSELTKGMVNVDNKYVEIFRLSTNTRSIRVYPTIKLINTSPTVPVEVELCAVESSRWDMLSLVPDGVTPADTLGKHILRPGNTLYDSSNELLPDEVLLIRVSVPTIVVFRVTMSKGS